MTDERTKEALRELASKQAKQSQEQERQTDSSPYYVTKVGPVLTDGEKFQRMLDLQSKKIRDDYQGIGILNSFHWGILQAAGYI
jgi:hypothetical protein